MSHDRHSRSSHGAHDSSASSSAVAPGKRTLTGALQLARRQSVQRDEPRAGAPPVAPEDAASSAVHAVAAAGVEGSGERYPHGEAIQRAFGRHDIGGARAHVGGAATEASAALGARAYATGDDVAFAAAPDLHTAAHEAAHVVQQRGGVQLAGGVGAAGDPYERHADEVADRVVAGASAEDLLDGLAGAGVASAGLQRKAVQFWDGHEHRAIGNMAALIATGESNFSVDDWVKKHGTSTFTPGTVTKSGGLAQSKDLALVDLEKKAGSAKVTSATSVENAPTVIPGPGGGPGAVIDNEISFGGMSELGGDFAKKPKDLLATEGENPTGNDYLTMAMIGATNINHFYPLNGDEYRTHHALALGAAAKGDRKTAIVEEGFAAHFLEDTFAAGHMAPRALDRVDTGGVGEDDLGLNRSKVWHDALNAVTSSDGLPTTRGRFHGDDTITGREIAIIARDVGASLKEVLTTLAGKPEPASIDIPQPDVAAIQKTPDYGPIWRRMMNDYEEDLRAGEKSKGSMTTDGGTTKSTADISSRMRKGVYGGERTDLSRVTNSAWNGPVLVFNLTIEGKPAPAGTKVYVKWFNCDGVYEGGYDRHASGRDGGTIAGEHGGGLNNTDPQVGPNKPNPDVITLTDAGVGQARGGEDNDGDTYAAFYADWEGRVPIGRSNVQGTSKGNVETPVTVSECAWWEGDTKGKGKTLWFKVKKADGAAAVGRTVYVQFFDCESSFDRDDKGYKAQTIVDGDPAGGVQTVKVTRDDAWASCVPTGKDDNPNDTYAVVYLDEAKQIPLARSPVQPGSFYQ